MSDGPQKKGTLLSVGIGLGIVLILISVAVLTEPEVFESRPVAVSEGPGEPIQLKLESNDLILSSRGVVQAAYLTTLSPGVSGKVNKIHPQFGNGEIILQGTPLVELEKFEYRAKLAKAQAELEQARLDVSTEQAEALKAVKKTYSSVAQRGKDSELVLRVPQRRAVNARLNAAEAYVEEAEQELRDTVLEAPYTCQVVECSVGLGSRVVAGQTVGKLIPLNERVIRASLPLEEFSALPRNEEGRVDAPLKAYCTLNNGKRLQWIGRVYAVDASVDSSNNMVTLIAALEPNDTHLPEWRVAPVNMTLKVDMQVSVPASVWIPSSALSGDHMIRVNTPTGVQERKASVIAVRGDEALVSIPGFEESETLIIE